MAVRVRWGWQETDEGLSDRQSSPSPPCCTTCVGSWAINHRPSCDPGANIPSRTRCRVPRYRHRHRHPRPIAPAALSTCTRAPESSCRNRGSISARRGVERLAGRAQRLMPRSRASLKAGRSRGRPPSFEAFLLLAAAFRLTLYLTSPAFAADLQRRGHRSPRGRHAHGLVGDAIGLMLQRIISTAPTLSFADGERGGR